MLRAQCSFPCRCKNVMDLKAALVIHPPLHVDKHKSRYTPTSTILCSSSPSRMLHRYYPHFWGKHSFQYLSSTLMCPYAMQPCLHPCAHHLNIHTNKRMSICWTPTSWGAYIMSSLPAKFSCLKSWVAQTCDYLGIQDLSKGDYIKINSLGWTLAKWDQCLR